MKTSFPALLSNGCVQHPWISLTIWSVLVWLLWWEKTQIFAQFWLLPEIQANFADNHQNRLISKQVLRFHTLICRSEIYGLHRSNAGQPTQFRCQFPMQVQSPQTLVLHLTFGSGNLFLVAKRSFARSLSFLYFFFYFFFKAHFQFSFCRADQQVKGCLRWDFFLLLLRSCINLCLARVGRKVRGGVMTFAFAFPICLHHSEMGHSVSVVREEFRPLWMLLIVCPESWKMAKTGEICSFLYTNIYFITKTCWLNTTTIRDIKKL